MCSGLREAMPVSPAIPREKIRRSLSPKQHSRIHSGVFSVSPWNESARKRDITARRNVSVCSRSRAPACKAPAAIRIAASWSALSRYVRAASDRSEKNARSSRKKRFLASLQISRLKAKLTMRKVPARAANACVSSARIKINCRGNNANLRPLIQ